MTASLCLDLNLVLITISFKYYVWKKIVQVLIGASHTLILLHVGIYLIIFLLKDTVFYNILIISKISKKMNLIPSTKTILHQL